MEYKGEVYHISNFLSLQIGKAYVPSSGRLSRWLSTSRCDFYDSVESRLNSDKAEFTLKNLVWARNGMGELFLVMLCNQKEACLRCLLR